MERKILAIICPAKYPVPATSGGAIETLIEVFLDENEIYNEYDVLVYSYFDEKAFNKSKKYNNVRFEFLNINSKIENIDNFFVRIIRKLFKISINPIFIRKVIKDINKKNIQTIIIEGNKHYVIPLKEKLNKSKIFLHIHHEAFNDNYKKNIDIINSCEKIITVSEYIKKKTLEVSGANKDKIVVLKNCTNVKLFNKESYKDEKENLKKRYNINPNEIVILFSGRILEIKGIRELIIAFKKYCKNLNAKLIIVGNAGFGKSITSEYDNEIIKLSEGLKDKIIFTGFINKEEMPKIHSIIDISVVPSIWDDPAPLVVIESMASGIPLIVTNSGGIPEYVTDECAIIIKRDKNMIDNMGKCLVNLIKDNEKRDRMGNNSRKNSLQFSTKNYYYNFLEIIKE